MAERGLERGPLERVTGREETVWQEALTGQDRLTRHLAEHQPNPEGGHAQQGRPPEDASEGRGEFGPHPVSMEELQGAFGPSSGWAIADISPDRVHTRYHDDTGAPAWLATLTRRATTD